MTFMVKGSGFMVHGSRFRVNGSRFRVNGYEQSKDNTERNMEILLLSVRHAEKSKKGRCS